ncbi:helix-turn-helix transcriptional regulator [Agreia bicolorata]|uniref:Transcriptional regulator n=1 Tax=Agreia bicolorata TaxID=110935 RepID=A0ABR5CCG2_9MICO|nr:WYL domain-containing protein [Agreia bicolorata]KJC63319.1 transcriptional regulator [Agreia bicolorata]
MPDQSRTTSSTEASAPAVAVEERLFSLVLALVSTEIGLTKAEILGAVQGYRQKFVPGGDNSSLERQFERDKDDIRELGVPLETLESPTDPGNNQALRYRIAKGDYDLPADITFTPEETTLLNLAAMVWREGSLSGESRRALLKLRSLGTEGSKQLVGYAPRIRTRDAAFGPLTDALDKAVLVRFSYLKPGEQNARERTVAPTAVVQHQGRWYLQAEDQQADAPRTFLLSRIVGPVVVTRTPAPRPASATAGDDALAELDEIWSTQIARVSVRPGTDAESRLGKRRGSIRHTDGTIALHYTDLALLADDLAAFGPEVVVISPPALLNAVRDRLRAIVASHSDTVDAA